RRARECPSRSRRSRDESAHPAFRKDQEGRMSSTSVCPFAGPSTRRVLWSFCLGADSLEALVMETVSISPLATLRRGSARRLYEARTASRAGLDVVPGSASGGQAAPYQAFRTATSSVPPTKGQLALHSQTVQMVCHQFLANVDTACELRQTNRTIRNPDID